MNYILIPIIGGLMIMVVISLIRGIIAFMQSTRADLERDPVGDRRLAGAADAEQDDVQPHQVSGRGGRRRGAGHGDVQVIAPAR